MGAADPSTPDGERRKKALELLARATMHPEVGGTKEHRRVHLKTLHSCSQLCGRTPEDPRGDLRARAAARCSLVDFPPEDWDPAADEQVAYEAEHLAGELLGAARSQGRELDYDLDRDGCAYGWAVCGWADSVKRLMGRRRADNHVRDYPLITQRLTHAADTPPEIFEAIELAQAHEDGSWALFHKRCNPR